MKQLNWADLLCAKRFSTIYRPEEKQTETPPWILSTRTQAERDYDRILFSTPLRRLGDKTQVFPLEKIESIRRRLTHSHEVSNLARSIGVYLVNDFLTDIDKSAQRDIPAILAAIGLAHDLGNPPFGHNGEDAIRAWFKKNKVFSTKNTELQEHWRDQIQTVTSDIKSVTPRLQKDFLNFESNAQTLRILTKLQVVQNDLGLNLTLGTLAAIMKYPISADKTDEKIQAKKKPGFFASEAEIVKTIWERTGLGEGKRHPLTYIMEACDDIAYSILDAEDAVKKQIVSYHDVIAWLEKHRNGDELTAYILNKSREDHGQFQNSDLSPAEINDVSMQKFRVHAINATMSAAINCFKEKYQDILNLSLNGSLLENSMAKSFYKNLKKFDRENAYKHRSVLENELNGYNTIQELMDLLWKGITEREDYVKVGSERSSPFAKYAYRRISENYRRIFEGEVEVCHKNSPVLPIRYREAQLLTDMISGMTDNFASELLCDLKKYYK